MYKSVETVIVGGGQAGLATSYYLKKEHHEHIILEQAPQVADAWRNHRWDSFSLLTPNWSFRLPGAEYDGPAPDGFMPKDEILQRFEQYTAKEHFPIEYNQKVESIDRDVEDDSYLVHNRGRTYLARNVVIATGLFQQAKVPAFSASIPAEITQITADKYRSPASLPPGAVLVVGSAQSGCQIAEELYLSGRKVYLSLGSAGRVPRRYRGKDIYEWMQIVGHLDRTPDMLPSPKGKFASNPHVSGRDGGRTLNLHQFARDGVILLGHIRGVEGRLLHLAGDANECLAKSDQVEVDLVAKIDGFVTRNGLDVPEETLPALKDGFKDAERLNLDLAVEGITSIIWAVGFNFDFSMIHLPVLDGDGFPLQNRGVTNYRGLYFVGMPWIYKFKSGHLLGMGEDAAYIASKITGPDTSNSHYPVSTITMAQVRKYSK